MAHPLSMVCVGSLSWQSLLIHYSFSLGCWKYVSRELPLQFLLQRTQTNSIAHSTYWHLKYFCPNPPFPLTLLSSFFYSFICSTLLTLLLQYALLLQFDYVLWQVLGDRRGGQDDNEHLRRLVKRAGGCRLQRRQDAAGPAQCSQCEVRDVWCLL